ncbi:MAG: MarR family transcriptional regulator, partial [Chloroflexi bacterium]
MAARLALRRMGWTTRTPRLPAQLLQQAPVKRMVSSSFSPPSFLAQKNLAHERVIPVIDGYNFYVAQPDWTDALLNRLAATRSAREIEPFEVTARISRLSLHIARIQEESFGRFGLNRGEVGVLAALMLAGPKQRLSPTQLFKGLMLSSAGITSRLDRLESRGYLKRTRHATDRRSVLVEITESGRKVLDQA